MVPTVQNILARVVVGTDQCWRWQGWINKGYGMASVPGRGNVGVHRLTYELLVGPIPFGLHLDHLCRNPSCVNPAHLEPVTAQENLRRGQGWAGINARKTHCPQGHEYTASNTYQWRGQRRCRECQRVAAANYRRRKALIHDDEAGREEGAA